MDARPGLSANADMNIHLARILGLVLLGCTPVPGLAGPEGLRLVAAPGFEDAGDAFAGVVPLRQDGLWGLMGADGNWRAKPQFQAIGRPGLGRLPVERDGLWGVVDARGRIVTPFAFQEIGQVADWTPMRWQGHWWAVGPDGQPEGQPLPFQILIGNDGACIVGKAGGAPVAVFRGTPAASTMLGAEDEMRAPSDGLVPIVQNGRAGHLDCASGTVLGGQAQAPAVRGFHQGWAARQGGAGWGWSSVFSNAIEFGGEWAAAGDFAEGLAPVQDRDGLWGFVREGGGLAIAPAFQEVGGFSQGMAPARSGAAWGFIGRSGDWLVQPRFQAVRQGAQGVAAARIADKWGVIAVSPWRIAAQTLRAAVPSGAAACPSHVLSPGTVILSAPGGATGTPVPPGAAWGICLGARRADLVEVLRDGQSLGWVGAAVPLPLR